MSSIDRLLDDVKAGLREVGAELALQRARAEAAEACVEAFTREWKTLTSAPLPRFYDRWLTEREEF